MGILKAISPNGTMLDLVNNVITNLQFYLKHRDELNDIRYSNEVLYKYLMSLLTIRNRFPKNEIPDWFKNVNASSFLSGSFPYFNALLDFCFSFKDHVDVLLYSEMKPFEYIIDNVTHHVTIKNAEIISSTEMKVNFNEILGNIIINKSEWLNQKIVKK